MNASSTDRIEKQLELNAPVSRVWRAVTDYKEFNQWFRVELESPFEVGKPTRGQITYPGCEHLVMELIVEKIEPERLFSYRWKPCVDQPEEGPDKDVTTLVEFTLEPHGDGTLLRISESGFDALSPALREESFRRNEGGWTEQMKHIEAHIQG